MVAHQKAGPAFAGVFIPVHGGCRDARCDDRKHPPGQLSTAYRRERRAQRRIDIRSVMAESLEHCEESGPGRATSVWIRGAERPRASSLVHSREHGRSPARRPMSNGGGLRQDERLSHRSPAACSAPAGAAASVERLTRMRTRRWMSSCHGLVDASAFVQREAAGSTASELRGRWLDASVPAYDSPFASGPIAVRRPEKRR